MKRLCCFFLILFCCAQIEAFGWGRLGHDASAMLAERHLTKKAKKNIAKYLQANSLTYWSLWMDYMGYVTKSGYSNDWFDHTVPVNDKFEYAEKHFPGDALMAVEIAIDKMKDGKYKSLDDSTVLLYLKHLIHFVPDMHCPSHVIYTFRPSNYWVTYDGNKRLFHWMWDSMPENGPHGASATEWCNLMDTCSKEEIARITSGTPRDWVHDNAKSCIIAYDIIPENTDIKSPAIYQGAMLSNEQMLKGGYRLAYVLNMIFNE